MSTAAEGGDGGFFTFYREYAHTGLHTITATALTAFGLLTFVHRGFVVLAIAVYVIPPIYIYLTRNGEAPEPIDTGVNGGQANISEQPNGADAASGVDSDTEGPGTGTVSDAREPATSEEPSAGPESTASTTGGSHAERGEKGTAGSESPAEGMDAETKGGSSPSAEDTSEEHEVRGGPASAAVADTDEGEEAEWVETDSPTDETLHDAVSAGEDAYAAGEGGVLLAREDDDWELALESGPAAESTTLRSVDATDDGEAVWVAGDGGVLGRYDPTTTRHTDHSAPAGITDNWSGLAVAGTAGGERLALVNGSGQVLLGEYDGSEVEWEEPVKPGSGSSMSAITFLDESIGYCCDTNAGVYRIEGSEFERVGIEDASGFDALAATPETVAVASDDGTLQRFDGSVWTPVRVAEGALNGLATDGEEWLAVGAGGTIHENHEGDWEAVDSPTEADLHGVTVGGVSVAVGAGGTVVGRV